MSSQVIAYFEVVFLFREDEMMQEEAERCRVQGARPGRLHVDEVIGGAVSEDSFLCAKPDLAVARLQRRPVGHPADIRHPFRIKPVECGPIEASETMEERWLRAEGLAPETQFSRAILEHRAHALDPIQTAVRREPLASELHRAGVGRDPEISRAIFGERSDV